MKALYPTRYADSNNSTFVEISEMPVFVNYNIQTKKKYGIIPTHSVAEIEVNVGDGLRIIPYKYKIPRNLKIGKEIVSIEQALYGVMDEVIRSVVQIRAKEKTQKEVKQIEDEYLFPEVRVFREYLATVEEPEKNGRAQEYRVLDEFVDKLITAVKHVTDITSLNREGLEQYQERRTNDLEQVLLQGRELSDPTSLLQSVTDFVDSMTDVDVDIEVAQERTLSYLLLLEGRDSVSVSVTPKRAQIIAHEFVGTYLKIRKQRAHAIELPDDIIDHAISSFIEGGIKGWIALSWIGEAIINGIFKTKYEIPGWYIGAGIEFAWPYIKAPFKLATRNRKYERKLHHLIQSTNTKLLAHTQEGGSLVDFINESQEQIRRRTAEKRERLTNLNQHTPKLVEIYTTHMNEDYDEMEDVESAVSLTKKALIDTKVLIGDAFTLINSLAFGETEVDDLGEATAKIIRKLDSLPTYNISDVTRTIDSVKLRADADWDSSLDIAKSVEKLLS